VAAQEGQDTPDDLAGGVGVVRYVKGMVAVRLVDEGFCPSPAAGRSLANSLCGV
jgi:hypothetical protein